MTALIFADDAGSLRDILTAHHDQLARPNTLWVAYPKANRADINCDTLWPILGEDGMRPIGQVALDEVWSAMRSAPTRRARRPSRAGGRGRHRAGAAASTGHINAAQIRIWIACMTRKGDPMNNVTSRDGTSIAFDRLGAGPPVILVCGGSVDRSSNAPLAALLARHFTVVNYDRRGRGDSGDTAPYAVAREVEDIDAVVDAAGGSACLYGSSSGAALALEAARKLPTRITKLALWEPPFIPEGHPRPPADTARTFTELVAAGRRGDAVEFFMAKVVGLPAEFVAQARSAPFWQAQEALAHTLAYDATIMGDYALPTERAAAVTTPTIVIAGASFPFMRVTAQALADILPDGQTRTLEGQPHNVDPEAIAPVLVEFFKG